MTRQIFQYDRDIGFRFVSGVKARLPRPGGGAYLIRANNRGFRCDHDVVPERTGPLRALLFGDSFTAGDLVSNGRRFGDLLERSIPGLEVLNYGLPGTGTDQHYLAYRHHAADVEHDLMIIAVQVENIRRVTAAARVFRDDDGREVIYAKPYYELVGSELVLRNVPVRKEPMTEAELDEQENRSLDRGGRLQSLRSLVNRLGLRDVAQRVTRYQPLPEYDRADHPSWLLMRAILERWIREHGPPVLLVPIPLYHYVEGHSDPSCYRARLREVARVTGCGFHDPLDDLTSYPEQQRRGFRFDQDPHPTEAGHAALAESLAPAVADLLGRSGGPS